MIPSISDREILFSLNIPRDSCSKEHRLGNVGVVAFSPGFSCVHSGAGIVDAHRPAGFTSDSLADIRKVKVPHMIEGGRNKRVSFQRQGLSKQLNPQHI